MPPHTKMEKTPHFAQWASAVNIVKKHELCVNPGFKLKGLNASINKTTFWDLGDFREPTTIITTIQFKIGENCPSRRVSLQNLSRWPSVLAPQQFLQPIEIDCVKKQKLFLSVKVRSFKQYLGRLYRTLCTVIKRFIPVLAVVLGYCQNHETSGNILVPLLVQE